MDVKVRNKVAEIQQALEQDEQRISLSDPVAKMMLVALAHQSCEIERKMDQTVERLSERFCDQVLLQSNLKAQPAVTVLSIGNGRECTPYFIDENDAFTYKPTKCNYRPIFKTRIVPGRLMACFMNNTLLQPDKQPVQATWPDNRYNKELWLAFDAAGEVNTLEDVMIALSHPLPDDSLTAEVGDVQIPLSLVMEDMPRTLNSNFMLAEFWKKSLVYYGLWLYRFGKCSNKRTLHRGEIPAWIMDSYAQEILEPFIGNRFLWIRIKTDRGISLPLDTAILLNCIPAVNYDIQDVKLNYSEPIQRLENDKTGTYFLDVVQNQEQAQDFFIRDFDVNQYDNERIREDVTNLYRHYVNDYFAFVDSNSLHDGATLRSLRQSMMQVYDSLDEFRSGNVRPYGGTYAIRNPRNNQQPMVLTYFTTNGERGNLLRRGGRLTSTNAAVGDVEALIDATGGRNKVRDIKTRKELARHIVNSNDRLFTKMDLLQYCKMEFMRAFGEEAISYCQISLSDSNIPVDGRIEKCIVVHFNVISESLKEEVNKSDFFDYLKINIELRKSFSCNVALLKSSLCI
ncbi:MULTISPECIES: hypothetical protein [Bacteroides]|uniref:hypothetical protein n=1 Tax=Bacteroides TaxID=816 RepID=UPI000B3A2706|nr:MULTISPECIES: hypothetical protein [Bacteroides]MBM6943893.1 hypothetical protein [Bacteroides gallinaceum]OUO63183.1 hypothetical protein B5F78_01160 [Bacteroides sp. An279]